KRRPTTACRGSWPAATGGRRASRPRPARPTSCCGRPAAAPRRRAGSAPPPLAEANWLDAAGRRELETIFDLAASVEESAKGIQLGKMLAARQSKAVVFTEFIPTLDHLRRVCEQHDVPYAFFSGELSRAGKDAAIGQFRDHARVLLSTGAGGEGRNLQFADTLVNFDLPW